MSTNMAYDRICTIRISNPEVGGKMERYLEGLLDVWIAAGPGEGLDVEWSWEEVKG